MIDWVAFECLLEITQAREDPGALREILAVYEEDAIKALADIESLAHEETRRRLHKLKGASGSITFSAVVAK
ncbi:MAG: hypothetical protein NXI02_33630, partial [Rhodobacteraceae bacterium]|nr:hypothetical protein [Paracoccaceae bacterium]